MSAYHQDIADLGFPDDFLDTPPPPVTVIQHHKPLSLNPWPINLPMEIALCGGDVEAVFEARGITVDEYSAWEKMPAFRKALSDAAAEVRNHGVSFRTTVAGMINDFLPLLDQALHDENVGLSTKIDVLKSMVRWAGLEQKEEKVAASAASQVNIQINL